MVPAKELKLQKIFQNTEEVFKIICSGNPSYRKSGNLRMCMYILVFYLTQSAINRTSYSFPAQFLVK